MLSEEQRADLQINALRELAITVELLAGDSFGFWRRAKVQFPSKQDCLVFINNYLRRYVLEVMNNEVVGISKNTVSRINKQFDEDSVSP